MLLIMIDPYWGQLQSINEAGGLWLMGFDPLVGPTLEP